MVAKQDENMKLPLKVKLYLQDKQVLVFEGVKVSLMPMTVNIIENDKPDITRIFPWTNIRELELPVAVDEKKVVQPGQGLGLVR